MQDAKAHGCLQSGSLVRGKMLTNLRSQYFDMAWIEHCEVMAWHHYHLKLAYERPPTIISWPFEDAILHRCPEEDDFTGIGLRAIGE